MAISRPATQLRIDLLGQPRFLAGAEPFRFSGRPKLLPLLCYLLLHNDRPVARDSLAYLLWEDEEEEKARVNLRRHLHELVRALPATTVPWIIADSETVAWNSAAPLWLDVAEFERQIASGERMAAVELYRGDLLENLYEEWLVGPRERLRAAYLTALTDLVVSRRAVRDFAGSADCAQRLLACDPWREDIVRQLMSVKYESGDGAGALHVYERFIKQLREEMNVAPMPETVVLRDTIVRNSPLPASVRGRAEESIPEAVRPQFALIFAGRESEMQRLHRHWERAARGHGGSILLAGEPGIGKTRLASELVLRCEAQAGRILWGTTNYPESVPYKPFTEALRSVLPLVAALDVRPVWLAALARLLPELVGLRDDLPVLSPLDPERERTRLLESLIGCVCGLAKPRPVVLVLDDLHWAGVATTEAFEAVCRRASRHAVLVVGISRDADMPVPLRLAVRRLRADSHLHHVALSRLKKDAVESIVRASSSAFDSDAVAARLYTASEGNPLFLGELIRAGADGEHGARKVTLPQVVGQRVAGLSEAARFLAGVASAVGPAFDVDVVRELTGWTEPQLFQAVAELLSQQLIREVGRRSGFDYAFTHQLVRAAIYEAIEPRVRAQRHRQAAAVFAALYPESDEIAADVARHYWLGGQPQDALPFELRAARHADAVHALDEALEAIERALPHVMENRLETEFLLLRESIERRRGNRDAQRTDLARLTVLAGSDTPEQRAEIVDRRIELAHVLDDPEEESRLIEHLAALTAALPGEAWSARVNVRRAQLLALKDHQAAQSAALLALASHRALGDMPAQVSDLCMLASMAVRNGALEQAETYLARAQALARDQGDPQQLAQTLLTASESAMVMHRLDESLTLATSAHELYVTLGDRHGEATALGRSATALARLGRDAEAREINLSAAAIFSSIGKPRGEAIALVNASLPASRLGLFASAEPGLQRALAIFSATHDVYGQAVCTINLSYGCLQRGAAAEAKRFAALALDYATTLQNKVFLAEALANLGAAERDLGELTDALAHMEAGMAHQAPDVRRGDRLNDQADFALARFYAGDCDEAAALADEFIAGVADEDVLNLWPHKLAWYAARIYRAVGRTAEARALVERAYTVMQGREQGLANTREREEAAALPLHRSIAAAFERNEWPSGSPSAKNPAD